MIETVLWLPSDLLEILRKIVDLAMKKTSLDEYKEALKPLEVQAALKEQTYIIHKLVDSGMSLEEIAFRLQRTKEDIVTLYNLDISSGILEYNYSYITGTKPFSIK